MLILTRKAGESLHIGDNITVTVISVQGKQVRLGIAVPAEVTVFREEIYSRIKDENQMASLADNSDLMIVAKLWQGVPR